MSRIENDCIIREVQSTSRFMKKKSEAINKKWGICIMNKNKEDDSFSNLKASEKIVVVVALSLLIIGALAFVVGLFFFGFAGLFRILGVHYDSVSALFLFVVLYFVVGLILDFLSIVLFKLLVPYITGKYQLFFTRMVVECTFSWFAFHTVDELMSSITVPLLTEIVVVIIFFLIEYAFDGKKR